MRIERIGAAQHPHRRADVSGARPRAPGRQAPRRLRRARATRRGRGLRRRHRLQRPVLPARAAAAARDRARDRARARRAVGAQSVHDASGRDRRPGRGARRRVRRPRVPRARRRRVARPARPRHRAAADCDPRRRGRSSALLLAGDESGFDGELFRLDAGNRLAYEPVRPLRAAARRHVVAAPDGLRRGGGRRAEARRLREPRDGRA